MDKLKKFEDCKHHGSWYTSTGKGKILYCRDCDSLFTITKCEHCKGEGGFYIKIEKVKTNKENKKKNESRRSKKIDIG